MPDDFKKVLNQRERMVKELTGVMLDGTTPWEEVTDEVLKSNGARSYRLIDERFIVTIARFPIHGTDAYRAMAMSREGLLTPLDPIDVEKVFKLVEARYP